MLVGCASPVGLVLLFANLKAYHQWAMLEVIEVAFAACDDETKP
jgi:hypothetical protein